MVNKGAPGWRTGTVEETEGTAAEWGRTECDGRRDPAAVFFASKNCLILGMSSSRSMVSAVSIGPVLEGLVT